MSRRGAIAAILMTLGLIGIFGTILLRAEPSCPDPFPNRALLTAPARTLDFKNATAVTLPGYADDELAEELSGASWHHPTRTLYLCRDKPSPTHHSVYAVAIADDQTITRVTGWSIRGDLEAITVIPAEEDEARVLILDEHDQSVSAITLLADGSTNQTHRWSLAAHVPTCDNLGPEGLAVLPSHLRDPDAEHTVAIAHQNGGGIYVFALDADAHEARHLATWTTHYNEAAGLDATPEHLLVLHGGNHNIIARYLWPQTLQPDSIAADAVYTTDTADNLEGLTLTADNVLYLTTDDGDSRALTRISM